MPDITENALEWARKRFKTTVEELLENPYDLIHPRRDVEPDEYIVQQKIIAHGLGLNFDEILNSIGDTDDYAHRRLRQIEKGVIKPPPREKI